MHSVRNRFAIPMACPEDTVHVEDLTVDSLGRFAYGYHVIAGIAIVIDAIAILLYTCTTSSSNADARRHGIVLRAAFFIVVGTILLWYTLLGSAAGISYAASDAYHGPIIVIAALLILHAVIEILLVFGRTPMKHSPSALSAISDILVAYVGIVYMTRPAVDVRGVQATALWIGFFFIFYALLALINALRFSTAIVGMLKLLSLIAIAVLFFAASDPAPLDSVNVPPDIVCSRSYASRSEFTLHIGLLVLSTIHLLAAIFRCACAQRQTDGVQEKKPAVISAIDFNDY